MLTLVAESPANASVDLFKFQAGGLVEHALHERGIFAGLQVHSGVELDEKLSAASFPDLP